MFEHFDNPDLTATYFRWIHPDRINEVHQLGNTKKYHPIELALAMDELTEIYPNRLALLVPRLWVFCGLKQKCGRFSFYLDFQRSLYIEANELGFGPEQGICTVHDLDPKHVQEAVLSYLASNINVTCAVTNNVIVSATISSYRTYSYQFSALQQQWLRRTTKKTKGGRV